MRVESMQGLPDVAKAKFGRGRRPQTGDGLKRVVTAAKPDTPTVLSCIGCSLHGVLTARLHG